MGAAESKVALAPLSPYAPLNLVSPLLAVEI